MVIETKLNVGDSGYFMMQNEVCIAKIVRIIVSIGLNERTDYVIDKNPKGSNYTCHFWEHDIYGTKEELLTSL